jgi:gliding motility-associated-like protein
VVFVLLGSNGSSLPANGTLYTANTTFTAGTRIGTTGWYCVYNGTGSSVDINGLSAGMTYRVTVEEYSGTPGDAAYLDTNPPVGSPNFLNGRLSPANVTTVMIYPTVTALRLNFTNTTTTSTTVNWTSGNGTARAVFVAMKTSGSALPVDNTVYSADPNFGSGTQIGSTGWYCIYNGTGSSANITGLLAGTSYRVTAVEYNTIGGVQKYLVTGLSPATVTTVMTYPTVDALLVNFTNTADNTTTVKWTNGNGILRAVFIAKTVSGHATPVDNTSYSANPVFGSGNQIGSTGWYCIYNGAGSTVNISGLIAGTAYRVTVVEYNGGTGAQLYQVTGLSPANVYTTGIAPLNGLYIPGGNGQTAFVSSFGNAKIEANNILSPNGDGINDIWVVKNIAFYPNNTVSVYDKEGKVVFIRKGYTNDWDGTYRGSVLNEGTYYYTVDLGNGTTKKGFITVVVH